MNAYLYKKIKILYIESNKDGTIGGSYYSLLYLIKGLDKNIYEPIVMFFQDNPLVHKFEEFASEVIIFDHESPSDGRVKNIIDLVKFFPKLTRDILLAQFKIKKKLDVIKPDIVHLNNSYAANHDWVLACKLLGIKIIAHDRGTRPPASFQTRFFVKFLDAIICVSDAYLNYITDQKLRPKFACRIYNGLDIKDFTGHFTPSKRTKLRKTFGVGDEDILIGIVGNIDFWKGQIVFVKSMSLIMSQYQNIKAVLVGKTPIGTAKSYEADIRSFISYNKLNDKIFLTGYREDIPDLLNAFDIFVHASIEPEPFGRVIIEAMAMKKPIVATRLGGPAEIIVDGESGTLVAENDENEMTNAILNYIKDKSKAEEMGQNAYIRFIRNFSSKKMAQETESLYRMVLTPKP